MWWKSLFRRKQLEQDLEEEIRSHLAIEAQQRRERGESPADAEERPQGLWKYVLSGLRVLPRDQSRFQRHRGGLRFHRHKWGPHWYLCDEPSGFRQLLFRSRSPALSWTLLFTRRRQD